MKNLFLATAFAVATLTGCTPHKTCPAPVVTKEVKTVKVSPKPAVKKAQ